MSTPEKSNWKLGAVIALILLSFVVFVFYIGMNKNLFSTTITLSGLFPDVSGVKPGNSVRIAGIEVGTVTEIEFVNDSLVRVYTVVTQENQKFIKSDSKMAIGSDGLLGDKLINILKGSHGAGTVEDGAELATVKPFDSEKLLASVKKSAANALVISKEFSRVNRNLSSTNGVIGRYLNDPKFLSGMSNVKKNLDKMSSDSSQDQEVKPAKRGFSLKRVFKKKKKDEETENTEQEDGK